MFSLNYNDRFIKHSRMVTGKELKSLNVLMSNTRQLLLSPKIACQLFDVFVGPVLVYGTETWGFIKETSIEKFHLKFCKKLLSVYGTETWGFIKETSIEKFHLKFCKKLLSVSF